MGQSDNEINVRSMFFFSPIAPIGSVVFPAYSSCLCNVRRMFFFHQLHRLAPSFSRHTPLLPLCYNCLIAPAFVETGIFPSLFCFPSRSYFWGRFHTPSEQCTASYFIISIFRGSLYSRSCMIHVAHIDRVGPEIIRMIYLAHVSWVGSVLYRSRIISDIGR